MVFKLKYNSFVLIGDIMSYNREINPLNLARILSFFAVLFIFILLAPNIKVLFLAICVSVLTLPIFEKLEKKYSPLHAIFIYTFALIFAFILPISLALILLIPQITSGIIFFQNWIKMDWQFPEEIELLLTETYDKLIIIPQVETWIKDLEANFNELVNTVASNVLSGSLGLANYLLSFGWALFLFIMLTIIFLAYATPIKNLAEKLLDFDDGMFDRFLICFRDALKSVVLGILLVAFLQGIVCTIGFFLFKAPEPLFWGLLACLLAPIPIIGTAIVWVPLVIHLWITGSTTMAILLAIWCFSVVGSVDNFTRPYFLSTGIKAPFILLFLALLTGLGVFGTIGLIIGPVLLAFAMQCFTESTRLLQVQVPKIIPEKEVKSLLQKIKKNKDEK